MGQTDDPLMAARTFVSREQHPNEKFEDFAAALKKLFKQAYPSEALTSSVLLQRFVTGLSPSISKQILLRGRPKELSEAIEGATAVEYALSFGKGNPSAESIVVHAVQSCAVPKDPSQDQLIVLQKSPDEMRKRMEALETTLTRQVTQNKPPMVAESRGRERRRGVTTETRSRSRRTVTCYFCGQEGHIQRNCPSLNCPRGQLVWRAAGQNTTDPPIISTSGPGEQYTLCRRIHGPNPYEVFT